MNIHYPWITVYTKCKISEFHVHYFPFNIYTSQLFKQCHNLFLASTKNESENSENTQPSILTSLHHIKIIHVVSFKMSLAKQILSI